MSLVASEFKGKDWNECRGEISIEWMSVVARYQLNG